MKAELSMSECAKSMTFYVHVKGLHLFELRVKLGLLFVRLGVWIIGMGFKVKIEE